MLHSIAMLLRSFIALMCSALIASCATGAVAENSANAPAASRADVYRQAAALTALGRAAQSARA